MSTFTVDFPPFDGTLSSDREHHDIVYLGNNKFLYVVAQTSPQRFIHAFVLDWVDLESPMISHDNFLMDVRPASLNENLRVFRINDNKALMILNQNSLINYYFLDIDRTTNIVSVASGPIPSTMATSFASNDNRISFYPLENEITGETTHFRVSFYNGTWSLRRPELFTIIIDPTNNSIVEERDEYVVLEKPKHGESNYDPRNGYRLIKLPNSQNRFLEILIGSTTSSHTSGRCCQIIDEQGVVIEDILRNVTNNYTDVSMRDFYTTNFRPISNSAGMFMQTLTPTRTELLYTDNDWQFNSDIRNIEPNFGINTFGIQHFTEVIPFDEYHQLFIHLGRPGHNEPPSAGVWRRLSDFFGEWSPATIAAGNGGMRLPATETINSFSHNRLSNIFQKFDEDTYIFFFFTNRTTTTHSLSYRIIHHPPS